MRKVQVGDVVSIHCVGKLKNGEVFENTFEKEPFVFQVGSPEIIPGLSEAVIGMTEGEEKEVVIPPEKGFGPRDENLVRSIPKDSLSLDVEPEPGLMLNLIVDTPQGEMTFPATIVEITDNEIVLDLNPPLAGQDLIFQIKVEKIINPNEKDIIL
ncbi:FKBP-type peptidyl-prolyl cis-trans isomerase [Thermodesulfobacterium hydrogeniphilum]|uniref:FKBP-type peptidyl-prolyl cis-trans isomerase n=1 Tax=Thermodesulfobacterium hydrogeniphilum TaxID=161156 RepID=UPI00056EFB23|nr:peptidylprolyl isomerase [Thermodesulfobacterium hydrogeniphilum]